MTMEILCKIMEENDIPEDVHFMGGSGWECDPTEINGVFYQRESNTIVFTQGGCSDRQYVQSDEWEILYNPGWIKFDESGGKKKIAEKQRIEKEERPGKRKKAYGLKEEDVWETINHWKEIRADFMEVLANGKE